MSTASTPLDRAFAVVGHAIAGDRLALDALLASLDAPQLRRLLSGTVTVLADVLADQVEAAGVPRREAAAHFRRTNPNRRAVIEQRGNKFEQER